MFAAYSQIERVRALRLLDAAQAAAYPQMGTHGKGFIDGLLEQCRGVVAEARDGLEQIFWNKEPVSIRAFKAKAREALGRAVGR